MNHSADAHAHKDIRKNLPEGGYDLIPGIDHTIPHSLIRRFDVDAGIGITDEIFYILLHM